MIVDIWTFPLDKFHCGGFFVGWRWQLDCTQIWKRLFQRNARMLLAQTPAKRRSIWTAIMCFFAE